jgi:hypothetical protein
MIYGSASNRRSVSATKLSCPASFHEEVQIMNPIVQLLEDKRNSAEIDLQMVERQLNGLDEESAANRTKIVLRYVKRMYRENIMMLDDAIQNIR